MSAVNSGSQIEILEMKKNTSLASLFMPFEKKRPAAAYLLIFLSVWNLPAFTQDENEYFVSTLAAHDDEIYVGGHFKQIGGIRANNMAVWNIKTQNFSGFQKGRDSAAFPMAGDKRGGAFASGYLKGQSFTLNSFHVKSYSQNAGMDAMAVSDQGEMYAAYSYFYREIDISWTRYGLAKWDGAAKQWFRTNVLFNGSVNAMLIKDSLLYAGGSFTTINGNSAELFGQLKLSEITFDLEEEAAYEQPPLMDEPPVSFKIISTSSRKDSLAVANYLYEKLGSIDYCYNNERKKDPTLKGQLKIGVKVNSKGQVIGVNTLENNTGGALLAKCIEMKIRSWLLPNSNNGGTNLQLEFTLKLPQ